ncbi:MAG: DUF4271 domain-containing protein [Flavobacteriales bacterium]|nr:DUF4271 domain-containing protein [Flavobacteriales bacterium]MCB9166899.1 DUF4271 domain-containing protein [Flavobacteriales bacterium]
MMGTLRGTDPLSTDWSIVVLLLVVGYLAWTNLNAPRKWRLLWETVERVRISRRSMREDINLNDRSLIGLWIMAGVIMALFLYQVGVYFGALRPRWDHFAELALLLMVLAAGQVVVQRLTGWLFKGDGGLQEYTYNLVLGQVVTGLALLPVSVLVVGWSPWRQVLVIVGLAIILLVHLVRWVRALVIGRGAGLPTGHIFLYLCATEILPLAILIRTLQRSAPPASQLL